MPESLPPLSDTPFGQHRGPLHVEDDFSVLDDPLEQDTFTRDCDDPTLKEAVLMVQGMYCAACADAVESALDGRAGVQSARVHAATRRLTVRWDPARVQLSQLARSVGDTGYRLLPMQRALGVEERLAETRQALWRLFVAGFCMMQVMMYAFPAYVAAPGDIPDDIAQLLRWASWMLSLPVVLFASRPFFQSAWQDLRHGRIGMDTTVSLGILVAFVVSSAATFDPSGPWGHEVWFDSLTMFVFFLLGGRYLEFKARDRTAGALDELMNRLPPRCEREQADGQWERVSLKRLVVGDVVRVYPGEVMPGDAVLLSEQAMVDEALLTGESRPVARRAGEQLLAGSVNVVGQVRVRIERLGRQTRFAQIVQLMEQASTEKPRLARIADRIAGPFLGLVLLAALASALYWWQIDHTRALSIAVSVLIVTCPCALSLATPAAMLAAAGALARRGILVRRLQGFEDLSTIGHVVFDKTGTLTHDRLVLREVLLPPDADTSGDARERVLQRAADLARHSLHPVSRAIVAACPAEAVEASTALAGSRDLQDVPGGGVQVWLADGRCLRLGSARFTGLDEAAATVAAHGVGDTPHAFFTEDGRWLATLVMDEDVREDAGSTVQGLKDLGLQLHLLSGDRRASTVRVAGLLGLDRVRAQADPEHKLAEVVQLQQQGQRVAMVGDGLNDGPVLARADVSFALGHGSPLTQVNADFVIQSGRLSDLLLALQLSRRTMAVVRQNLWWAAVYNMVAVPFALLGWMPPWLAGLGMAASSLLVVLNAMRLGHLPAGSSGAPVSDVNVLR